MNSSDQSGKPEIVAPASQSSTASPQSASMGRRQMPTKLPKTFIAIVVVIFVGLIVVLSMTKTKKASAPPPTAAQQATTQEAQVSVTAQGFVPASLQITTNTTVTWTNNDAATHEVAADPYPQDDSIPGFNSHVVLEKSDTTSFMFSKAGTYTYHDELNPLKLTGTIVVK